MAPLMVHLPIRLAFVSSSIDYTQGILPFVRRLEAAGHKVYWISFLRYESRWLESKGFRPEQILDTFSVATEPSVDVDAALRRLEGGERPFVNDIIAMDRLLRRKSPDFQRHYLAHLESIVTKFLVDRRIRLVSGGRDTALQLATSRICGHLRIPYVIPTGVRIPDDRYGFFLGHTESALIPLRAAETSDESRARAFLQSFRETSPAPTTVAFERRHNQFLRRLLLDVRLFVRLSRRAWLDRGNDVGRYTILMLFQMYLRRRWNALSTYLRPPYGAVGTRPFVLFAYHMQPESSIDVLASFHSDQHALIAQVARSVPAGYDFLVKPHPDHVGGLARQQLVRLGSIPGVTVIDPRANGRELMRRAALIVTPTGTMAYEAALHGIPSIIFAKEFFGNFPTIRQAGAVEDLPMLIHSALKGDFPPDEAATLRCMSQIFAHTAIGRNSSYFGPLSDQNLDDMELAYDQLFRALAIGDEHSS
jgi:hypothetical protein